MKKSEEKLFKDYGFAIDENKRYQKSMVSPVNNDFSIIITISFTGDCWLGSIENYFGSSHKFYGGTNYYNFKSLKVVMNRIKKDFGDFFPDFGIAE